MSDMDIFQIPRLTEEEFEQFAKLIYAESGINLKPNKITLLSNRLRRRLRELKLPDYASYLNYLRQSANRAEIIELLDVVSTNETYFFRNHKQFESMILAVQEIIGQQDSSRTLRIWSAGCSTGEEPYTIAIVMLENKALWQGRKLEILATDVSHSVLSFAKNAIYNGRRIEKVEPHLLKKYFQQINETDYKVDPEVSSLVSFQRHNLFQDAYPKDLDIIFNRNVMIYFDKEHQKKLVEGFAQVLQPKGFLFIGHAETLYNLTDVFTYRKLGDSSVYIKVKPHA